MGLKQMKGHQGLPSCCHLLLGEGYGLAACKGFSVNNLFFSEPWKIDMTSSMLDWLLTESNTTGLLALPV